MSGFTGVVHEGEMGDNAVVGVQRWVQAGSRRALYSVSESHLIILVVLEDSRRGARFTPRIIVDNLFGTVRCRRRHLERWR